MALRSPRILSLFTGSGMLDVAVKAVIPEARAVCYVERDACAAALIVAGVEAKALDPAPVWDLVETFDGRPWRGVVDIVIASPPCQPYSVAGRREGNDDARAFGADGKGPIHHLCRIVDEVRPELLFFENVPSWIRGVYFEPVKLELSGLGYRWRPPLFLAAEDVGAGHRRERVFVMAHSVRELGQTGAERMERTPGSDPGGGGPRSAVEHAERVGRLRGCGDSVDGPGATMGHSDMSPDRPGSDPAESGGGWGGFVHPGREVADNLPAGLAGAEFGSESGEAVRGPGEQGAATVELCLPFFPPGPGAVGEWRKILERDGSVKPAVRGMAHGVASRADRLRVIGNGVVPLQAAVAFDVLLSEIDIPGG